MGVQQYLIRRACGRGAFDPVDNASITEVPIPARNSEAPYVQVYDSQGWPKNAMSSFIKIDQIRAKNAILETVGVVERRNKTEKTAVRPGVGLRAINRWDILKSTPYVVGLFVRTVLNGWVYRLQASFLLGRLDYTLPFMQILVSEIRRSTLKDTIARSLAVSAIRITEFSAMTQLTQWFEKLSRPLMPRALRKKLNVGNKSDTWLGLFCVRVVFGVLASAVVTAPLTIYADLIAMGIYPGYFPPWRANLPRDPSCPLSWASLTGQSLWKVLGPTVLYSTVQHLKDLWEDDAAADDDDGDVNDDEDDENENENIIDQFSKPKPLTRKPFRIFFPQPVATLKNQLHEGLGLDYRTDGREHFDFRVYHLLTDPYSAVHLARSESASWPLKSLYLRSVWNALPPVLGAAGWVIGKRYETSPAGLASKAGLCAVVSWLVDVGVWSALWATTSLIGIERSV